MVFAWADHLANGLLAAAAASAGVPPGGPPAFVLSRPAGGGGDGGDGEMARDPRVAEWYSGAEGELEALLRHDCIERRRAFLAAPRTCALCMEVRREGGARRPWVKCVTLGIRGSGRDRPGTGRGPVGWPRGGGQGGERRRPAP